MSNFSVNAINGVYSYSSANIYSYLGRVPANDTMLKRAFNEFDVYPTGDERRDLKHLNNAMYAEYSQQVQEQIANQNTQKVVPWAGLMAQIGVQATGDRKEDYARFNEAIQLLSQSAIDGQAMAYFAGLRSEASKVFASSDQGDKTQNIMTYEAYKAQYLS